jgi:response regulator RpfG family c-di-GMP phosphodiesterase
VLRIVADHSVILITAGEANMEVLRELYKSRDIGCFIKKPVAIEQLVKRVKAELE